jgi:hypothetical protein
MENEIANTIKNQIGSKALYMIGLRRAYLEANEINPEDLEAAADLYDDLMAGDSNLGR